MTQDVNQVVAPDGLGSLPVGGLASSTYYGYQDYPSTRKEGEGRGFTLFQNISDQITVTPDITQDGTSRYVYTTQLLKDARYIGNAVRLFENMGYRLMLQEWR